MSAPDLTTKVIGYRAWRLTEGKLQPQNTVFSDWKVGVNQATCDRHKFHESAYCDDCSEDFPCEEAKPSGHSAPNADCECGLYALHRLVDVSGWAGEPRLLGAVAAWGRLEVHHGGFRAEYARPIALAYDDLYILGHHRKVGEFARNHGIRYMPSEELEEFAQAFGASVPMELRPSRDDVLDIVAGSPLWLNSTRVVGRPSFRISGASYASPNAVKPHVLLPEEGELTDKLGIAVEENSKDLPGEPSTSLQRKIVEGIDSFSAKRLLSVDYARRLLDNG